MSNTMDYDAFVDKLEELCDCDGRGYIKCLEEVKQLKQDNREMYRVNDHLNSLVGEDVKSQAKKYNELYVKSMELRVENRKLKKDVEKLQSMRVDDKIFNENIIAQLKKENEELTKKIKHIVLEYLDDPETEGLDEISSYIEQKTDEIVELKDEIEELEKENEELKETSGIGDGRQTYQQYYEQHTQEIKGLKNTIINNEEQHKLNMLEAKFETWQEVMGQYDCQYSIDDEITFLNDNSDNQEHIKKFFDELYIAEYEYDIETKYYKVSGESDEEDDEEQKQMDEFIDNVVTIMTICKN